MVSGFLFGELVSRLYPIGNFLNGVRAPSVSVFSVCISRPSTEVPAYIYLFIGQPVTLSGDSIKKSFAVEYGKGMRIDDVWQRGTRRRWIQESSNSNNGGIPTAIRRDEKQGNGGIPRSNSRDKCKQNNNGKRQSKQLYQ
ncbi:Uncharacterized protein APZ42_000530 [Daphnia magna]|uniref:Uncharacterized protein n=1 Tax=Daphnia magna TaxID=35525 RepID=A0A164JKC8_9CRUS|nr:Uncharacterized protein APZ42_000530 [Daphnia magna]